MSMNEVCLLFVACRFCRAIIPRFFFRPSFYLIFRDGAAAVYEEVPVEAVCRLVGAVSVELELPVREAELPDGRVLELPAVG